MNIKCIALALASLSLAACAAVAGTSGSGDSVRNALLQQRADGGQHVARATQAGLDGPAAKSSVDRYEKAAEAPVPVQNVLTIGVGGSASGNGQK